jgi:microsomal dipeptidase-like Zn-dependent dipeptidase
MTRSLQALGLLFIVGIAAALALGPGALESALNRVQAHDPWPVSDRARALHASLMVADLHADPLLWQRDWLERADRGHTDLPRALAGGVALQVMTAVTKSPAGQNYERNDASSDVITLLAPLQRWPLATWSSPFQRALYQGRRLQDWQARSGGGLRIIRSRGDLAELRAARAEGQPTLGVIFGIEGAHALDGDLTHLDALEDLGLRVVGLTHFFDNRIAGSLHGVSGAGLTELGRELVEQASLRHMVIDVAHASPRSVREVLALSERPVILSHGGFEGICDSARNLDDDLMLEIARGGGLVGVGFWGGAVCDYTPKGVVRAIRYGIDLLGVDHVALGSDYDGGTNVLFDVSEIAVLTETMLDEGFDEDEIRKVMGGNAFEFFETWLP